MNEADVSNFACRNSVSQKCW